MWPTPVRISAPVRRRPSWPVATVEDGPFGRHVAPGVLALLCDRDGTLVEDVPYNRDPDLVRPLPGVADALEAARSAGLRIGMVTDQSGVARGLITPRELAAVTARVEQLPGPFDVTVVCPHADGDGCTCRKPAPGMLRTAATVLRVPLDRCVMVGDIGADVETARAAGTTGILVPDARTLPAEIDRASLVAPSFADAVRFVLGTLREAA